MTINANSHELNLFHQMNEGILLLDSEFRIEYANPAFLSLTQVSSQEQIAGRNLREFISNEGKHILHEMKTSSPLEVSLVTSDDKRIHVEIGFSPLVCSEGSVPGYIVSVRDVSVRAYLQERSKESLKKYREIAFSAFDWLWEVDTSGTYTSVSASVEKHLGFRPEELFGRTAFDFMSAEEAERIASLFNRIASRNEGFCNLENSCITKSGEEVVISTSGVPIFDENGLLKGYRGGDRNITEAVKTSRALQSALLTTREIFEGLPVGVVVIDKDRRIRQINTQACKVIGREQDELEGQICHSAFCPALTDQCPIFDLGQSIDRAKRTILHKNGHEISVVKSVIPINLNSEDLLLEVFIDLSQI